MLEMFVIKDNDEHDERSYKNDDDQNDLDDMRKNEVYGILLFSLSWEGAWLEEKGTSPSWEEGHIMMNTLNKEWNQRMNESTTNGFANKRLEKFWGCIWCY